MVSRSPQRLAWIVVLVSFMTCCALAIGVPAGATSFVNNSSYAGVINVKLQAGRTIVFTPPGSEADARVVGQDGRNVDEGTTIIVDPDIPSQALLTIRESDNVTVTLVSMQLYSGSRVQVERARIPRFGIATTSDDIIIRIMTGRVQIQDQTSDRHDLKLTVRSEHMSAVLDNGAYSFEILPTETRLFVREGSAAITAAAKPETYNIGADQRTIVRQGEGITPGSYAPPRDLIRNGRFQAPLALDWQTSSEVFVSGDVTGTVRVITSGVNTSVLLDRPGSGLNWGRTGIQQAINENVSGRSSLTLRVNFTILYQELKVCGGVGSECPFMITLNYRNKEGGTSEWTQGFYADGTPRLPDLPDYIVQSPELKTKHIATRLGTAEPYESPNLIETLNDIEYLNYIQLYAEGHGVQTQINSVELLVLD